MSTTPTFPISKVRSKFPSLSQKIDGASPVFFDNPGGTQIADSVIDAMRDYFLTSNSNSGGAFETSRRTDRTTQSARQAMADFFNAEANEIVFGPNMTTLTFHISRSIGKTLKAGDEVVVTRMDHDANISPWLRIAEDHDLVIKWVNFDVETGRLDYDHLNQQITQKTKLVACTYASNALGTINDVKRVIDRAHAVGAYAFIDAVQFAPHGAIDVKSLDCDFLVASSYKFFGPHMGILYGKFDHLQSLPAYKVRPASNISPNRWETGTASFEGLAGVTGCINYLRWLGEETAGKQQTRREALLRAFEAIQGYERGLSTMLVDGLNSLPDVTVYGIQDEASLHERVPTIIFTVNGREPREVAQQLGDHHVFIWDGNYYALSVMESFGLNETGGMLRVGTVHYNTKDEINRFLELVEQISVM